MAKNLILWLVIAVVLMSVFQSFTPGTGNELQVDYTRFVQDVRQGQVREATVDRNGVIEGVKRSGESFVTVIPGGYDRDLINDLVKQGVRATGELPEEPSILTSIFISWFPMLLLIGVWIFFMRQMQGGGGKGAMSFGKSKARLLSEDQIKTTFADVAGCDEAKEEVAELVDYLKDPSRFQKLGGRIPSGVLMVGQPGTGKTLLAKAIAGEAKVPFFSISGSDFVEMFVGVGASRVRDMFEQAKKSAPCIIFIDEIDAVGRQRGAGLGGGHDEREQTLNQMLVEMDGFEGNEAALFAARGARRLVSMEEFEKAKDKILMGAERRSMVMSEAEKEMTAYHEAGHAIVGRLVPEHDPVYKVSIIPRGRALGVTMYLPEQDRFSHSKQHLESNISSLYGGRIAEEIIYGADKVSTGASNDIERATKLARSMVTLWGLSEKMGPMLFAEEEGEVFLGRTSSKSLNMSDETAQAIDEEIKEFVNRNYQRAEKLLKDNMDILHAMKDALMQYETIDANQIDDLMERRDVRPPTDANDSNSGSKPSSGGDAAKAEEPKVKPDLDQASDAPAK